MPLDNFSQITGTGLLLEDRPEAGKQIVLLIVYDVVAGTGPEPGMPVIRRDMLTVNNLSRLLMVILTAFVTSGFTCTAAQGILTLESGSVSFFSSTPVEDIKAENSAVTSSLSMADSSVVFSVPVTGFIFRKKLMQEHFNDQYMESKRFPTATFRGKLTRLPQTGAGASAVQVRVRGTLTIRDISRQIDETVTFTPSGSGIAALSEFIVRPADYGIKIPRILVKNIAEEVKVTINVTYSNR
ncbi:MAG: YceI family protein [Bacteroidetes bacterium]|nr:YceI family protein [Bacteroidota bacterium]